MYTQLVWGVTLGYLIFGQVPNGWTLAGASIVIGSGLYILNRERKARDIETTQATSASEPH
jgi:drug/metabolite transporter (DMT)-like permease